MPECICVNARKRTSVCVKRAYVYASVLVSVIVLEDSEGGGQGGGGGCMRACMRKRTRQSASA